MSHREDAIRYEIALSHVPGIGPARYDRLIERFGSAEAAWTAPGEQLERVVDCGTARSMLATRSRLDLDRALDRIQRADAEVVTRADSRYPELLRRLQTAPFVLYVVGDVSTLATRCVAVVGTRKASSYGVRAARQLAGDLAKAGITVVSGLARGIDSAAHRAALEQSGATVAVLGCGPDVIYPPGNRALRDDIVANGAVVTEYPPGTAPSRGTFPARNRIVSGLSLATVVVEAGWKSGAMITARKALDQGRDVFAVPGSIFSPGHAGANSLLASGAGVAVSASDVLSALDLSHLAVAREPARVGPVDEVESEILSVLGAEPVHIDELGRAAGLSSAEAARALTLMELRGLVENTGGMRWVAAT